MYALLLAYTIVSVKSRQSDLLKSDKQKEKTWKDPFVINIIWWKNSI